VSDKGAGPPDEAWYPPAAPVATPGCEVCACHLQAIAARKHARDESGASDCRVLMARHIDADHS